MIALAATLASYVWIQNEDISLSLQLSFQALLKHGRMNIFEFKNSKC
jgi:hypothetical protein